MIEYFHTTATRPQSASAFVTVTEKAMRSMDHMLGYRRRDRFVIFYYEPRGDEVLWRDSGSYGFATSRDLIRWMRPLFFALLGVFGLAIVLILIGSGES